MILVNYNMMFCDLHTKDLPVLNGCIRHPVYRRRLTTLNLIHGIRQQTVQPWEVMGVERYIHNGNLQVFLTPDPDYHEQTPRIGWIDADAPWEVECYSPTGELEFTIKASNFPKVK